jgi:predicted phage terminase large subunit-like protein
MSAKPEWMIDDPVAHFEGQTPDKLAAYMQLSHAWKQSMARENLVDFVEYMLPDLDDEQNVTKSEYVRAPHSMLLCDLVEQMEAGKRKKTAVSIPPQHGKTITISLYGLAWIWARNPRAKIIVVSYNQDRADKYGSDLRDVVTSERFRQCFPSFGLTPENKSKSYQMNTDGGSVIFRGAGGGITGYTGDFVIIDDPYKGESDEFTDTALEDLWDWFYKVTVSRANKKTRVFVVHTRWVEDDLIGRLCDPEHPERNGLYKGIAKNWFFFNLPGVIFEQELADMLGLTLETPLDEEVIEQFGARPMACLWDDDCKDSKDLHMYAEWKRGNPRTFSALVMGKPTPDEGLFFKAEHIVEYDMDDMPPLDTLNFYASSDHAVSEKQQRDYTILGCFGMDAQGDIWLMPDIVVERMETDRTVEEIVRQILRYKPAGWFMENELISKSFGPFLRRRMQETRAFTTMVPITPSKDKRTRAQSIRSLMANNKVHFPRFAPWWRDMKNQILRFPYATNDDFVDFISNIGNGLDAEYGKLPTREANDNMVPRVGSWEWIRWSSDERERQNATRRGGW